MIPHVRFSRAPTRSRRRRRVGRGLHLAAHRYRIDDLRKQALDEILGHLDKSDTIDFLFRSAYLLEVLRSPVIKFIAKECPACITHKDTRDKYKEHPEFSELLGELFGEYHRLEEN
ncbi:hypothetical protein BGZ74_002520 [Mortierella antarctica]|nr:hypothetical protein BGZ74_002520 [Mortierella antarctica]